MIIYHHVKYCNKESIELTINFKIWEYKKCNAVIFSGFRTYEQHYTSTGVALVGLADKVVQRLHHVEVDCGTNSSEAELQPKHHVELSPLEPQHCVVVLGNGQRLSPNTETQQS